MAILEFGQNQGIKSLDICALTSVSPWKIEGHRQMSYVRQAPPSPFQPLTCAKRLYWTFFNCLLSQLALQLLERCYLNPGVNQGAQQSAVRALKTSQSSKLKAPFIQVILLQVKEEDEEGFQGLKPLTKSPSVSDDNVILQPAHLQQLSSKDLK